ncbi:tetratricopeptide (TPR) repeat protein [Flavobacterium gossypii]|uniref:Tetratricopeptide (TPR) repeat protein n=1 Tax=Flavobacterium gossypii TaxID=1646119 RepID=A0ABR6DUE0_9FLAO|nr:tetratricopeptide repeat protein [Flavobacterium gossypii]MBA9075068.1 tetratricopeptide (TPR) repeat protein [Flavobacterium gossypii]
MKSKYLLLASAFLISGMSFAQKDEMKAAEKALKNGNPAEAKTSLEKAESLISNADESQKAQFYFLKGNAYLGLAEKRVDEGNNLVQAAKSYNQLIATEQASKKSKYTKEAEASLAKVKNQLVNMAIDDNKQKRFKEGAEKLYETYLLDKKDTLYLYYAASSAVNGQEYDTALKYYDELKKINYSGKATIYSAKSKANGEYQNFKTAAERDKMVKLGTHEAPKTEKEPSKRGEIYRNIALIYNNKGDVDAAKKALIDARAANPDDVSLTMTQADLYLKSNDVANYKKLVGEIIEKNPADPNLFYNLGVLSAQAKENAEAEKYYKKTIELDPNYVNAYLNLSVLKLESDATIVEEINKLGTSQKDNKRYEVLKAKREEIFKSTLPYLEKANKLDPKNEDVYKTLLNVYNYLEMTSEAKALKAAKNN